MKFELVNRASEEEQHVSDIECILIHGDKIFSCSDDGKVKIWSSDLKLQHEWKAHDYAVLHLLIFGSNLYTASVDMTIKIWDMDNQYSLKNTLEDHEEGVRRLATNGTKIYSGDDKGEVRVWTPEGNLLLFYGMVEEVWDLHVDKSYIYTVRDRDVIMASIKDTSDQYTIAKSIQGRAPMRITGDTLAFMERDGVVVNIHDVSQGFPRRGQLKGHEKIVTAMAGWTGYVATGGYDQEVRFWDTKALSSVGTCKIPGTVTAMGASPEGDVYVACEDGILCRVKAT
ncbi:uncharacterized protein LOC143027051 [Oratosquilla oratoria]|uniref:uncharacterized protein LOC143027051 n=1 Tax=Oratosquilla oratoria TaxID=337810 RepID=UPI003F75ACC6